MNCETLRIEFPINANIDISKQSCLLPGQYNRKTPNVRPAWLVLALPKHFERLIRLEHINVLFFFFTKLWQTVDKVAANMLESGEMTTFAAETSSR